MNERPILSIFIATYNRKEILLDKIRSLLEIKLDDFDIWFWMICQRMEQSMH